MREEIEMDRHTRVWLSQQPLWHDKDVLAIAATGFVLGFIVGSIVLKIFC